MDLLNKKQIINIFLREKHHLFRDQMLYILFDLILLNLKRSATLLNTHHNLNHFSTVVSFSQCLFLQFIDESKLMFVADYSREIEADIWFLVND
jgi:hypothetical protein